MTQVVRVINELIIHLTPLASHHLTVGPYLNLCARRPWHELGNFAQVDATCQIHFARVDLQDVQTGLSRKRSVSAVPFC